MRSNDFLWAIGRFAARNRQEKHWIVLQQNGHAKWTSRFHIVHSTPALLCDFQPCDPCFQNGFVWKCWVNLPNEIAIFHRDNDQQKHWVQWGTRHFQTHPYYPLYIPSGYLLHSHGFSMALIESKCKKLLVFFWPVGGCFWDAPSADLWGGGKLTASCWWHLFGIASSLMAFSCHISGTHVCMYLYIYIIIFTALIYYTYVISYIYICIVTYYVIVMLYNILYYSYMHNSNAIDNVKNLCSTTKAWLPFWVSNVSKRRVDPGMFGASHLLDPLGRGVRHISSIL